MRISSLVLNLANCSPDWCGEHCSKQLETCLIDCNADQETDSFRLQLGDWEIFWLEYGHNMSAQPWFWETAVKPIVHKLSPYKDCIRDCNRDFPKCETDCDLNQFLILGRTDFPSYEANGISDDIAELKHFNYHHHEVDMAKSSKYFVFFRTKMLTNDFVLI